MCVIRFSERNARATAAATAAPRDAALRHAAPDLAGHLARTAFAFARSAQQIRCARPSGGRSDGRRSHREHGSVAGRRCGGGCRHPLAILADVRCGGAAHVRRLCDRQEGGRRRGSRGRCVLAVPAATAAGRQILTGAAGRAIEAAARLLTVRRLLVAAEQQVLLRGIVVDSFDAHVRRAGGDAGLAGRRGGAGAAAAGAARCGGAGGVATLVLHVGVDVLQREVDRFKTN